MAQILLVQTDELWRNRLRKSLLAGGYQVAQADGGREALGCLRNLPVDLLITDIVMPEMDGLEIMALARGIHPGIKIVALAADAVIPASYYLKLARTFGAHQAVAKPCSTDFLLQLVRELLPLKA